MRKVVLILLFLLMWAASALAAISCVELTSGGDSDCNDAGIGGTNGGITVSVSPTSNALVLLFFTQEHASAVGTATASGNGFTYDQVATTGTGILRTTMFRALGASPSSGAITFVTSQDEANCTWSVMECTGVTTNGTNGSGAIVQSNTNTGSGATSLTVTLPGGFADATSNVAVGGFGISINSNIPAGSGFTEVGTQATGFGSRTMMEARTGEDLTVDTGTFSAASVRGIAVEIQMASTRRRMIPVQPYVAGPSLVRELLAGLVSFFVTPSAHAADFRNQFALLGTAGLGNGTDKEQQYCAIAKHWGYPIVLGDPWSASKANICVNEGLLAILNSNADRGGKWYNFDNPGTASSPANPTKVNIGVGLQNITSALYAEMEQNLCLTSAGVSMNYPTIYNGSSWKFRVYSLSDNSVIFMPNMYNATSIAGNVAANFRQKTLQEAAVGQELYRGVYFDETTFPTNFAPNCENPGNSGSGTIAAWDAGRKVFIKDLVAAVKTAVGASRYIGTSGNPWAISDYSPEQDDPNIAMDLLYSESSGGQACDTLAEMEAGAATGCGTQDSTTYGVVDPTNVSVQAAPTKGVNTNLDALLGDYRANQLRAGRAAHQGSYYGHFGLNRLPDIPNAAQLLRAIPNWDNEIGATSKTWVEGTDTYTSSNSRIDNNIAWSWHWRDTQKLFVVRHSGSPSIAVPAGKTLVTAKCTDFYGLETTTCLSGYFSQGGTTITLGGSIVNDKLYILYFSGAPTFLSATVSVANQLDICFSTTDGLAMLPATGATGFTVTWDGGAEGTVTSTNRVSNNCFRRIYSSGLTSGTQVVRVSYSPGNITDGSGTAAAAFSAQTATNTLGGGGTAPVYSQTRSQLRGFEGDQVLAGAKLYGSENGVMSAILNAKFRLLLKIAVTAADAPATTFPLYYDRNDSTWLPVTNSCSTSEIVIVPIPQIPDGTATAADQLTSGQTTNVAGCVVESAGQECEVTLTTGSETEMEYGLAVCGDAALGILRLRAHKGNGDPLDSYFSSTNPRATIIVGHQEQHSVTLSGGTYQ